MSDIDIIDGLTARFFDLFTNLDGKEPKVELIHELFIPTGMIISNTDGQPQVYNLGEFVAPRKKMLTNGTLTEFSEWETGSKTEVFRNIAHRFVTYEKSGFLNGVGFKGKGKKTIQFIKVNGEWKMSSVAWSDEI